MSQSGMQYVVMPLDKNLVLEGGPRVSYPKLATPSSDFKTETKSAETKPVDILLDYGTQPPKHYPFDAYEAYRTRLMSFINGAIYAITHSKLSDKEKKAKITQIKALAVQKNQELDDFKKQMQDKPVTFGAELYKFYNKELPKASGLKPKQIALGEAFYVWQECDRPARSTQYTKQLANGASLLIEQIERPQHSTLTKNQKKELLRIHSKKKPMWFKALDSWAQKALLDIVPQNTEGDWSNYQRCRPAVLRHIPGEANAATHELKITKINPPHDPVVLSHTVMRRQGAPTSFNMKDSKQPWSADSDQRQRSANENIAQMLDSEIVLAKTTFEETWGIKPSDTCKCPVFLGGLVSPLGLLGGARAFFLDGLGLTGGENNTKLANEKEQAVKKYKKHHPDNSVEFFDINVPVNGDRSALLRAQPDKKFVRFVDEFYGKMQAIAGHTDARGDIGKKLNNNLNKLHCAKEMLMALPDKSEVSGRNQNLYLAALYDVTTRLMGGLSTGNCKSSKDRKGVATLMADAMLIYYAERVALGQRDSLFPAPDATGPERDHFVAIFCELYASGHQLLVAHDNGPGCPGIKDEKILDADIVEKLQSMQRQALATPAPAHESKSESKSASQGGAADSGTSGDGQKPQKISTKDTKGVYAQSKEVAEFNKPGTKWQKYRKKVKQIGIPSLTILLAATGVALVATGVLAPLGVGVIATAAIVGGGMGLGAGGLAFAGTQVADWDQDRTDKKNTFKAQIELAQMSNGGNRKGKKKAGSKGSTVAQVRKTLSINADPDNLDKLREPLLVSTRSEPATVSYSSRSSHSRRSSSSSRTAPEENKRTRTHTISGYKEND